MAIKRPWADAITFIWFLIFVGLGGVIGGLIGAGIGAIGATLGAIIGAILGFLMWLSDIFKRK